MSFEGGAPSLLRYTVGFILKLEVKEGQDTVRITPLEFLQGLSKPAGYSCQPCPSHPDVQDWPEWKSVVECIYTEFLPFSPKGSHHTFEGQ